MVFVLYFVLRRILSLIILSYWFVCVLFFFIWLVVIVYWCVVMVIWLKVRMVVFVMLGMLICFLFGRFLMMESVIRSVLRLRSVIFFLRSVSVRLMWFVFWVVLFVSVLRSFSLVMMFVNVIILVLRRCLIRSVWIFVSINLRGGWFWVLIMVNVFVIRVVIMMRVLRSVSVMEIKSFVRVSVVLSVFGVISLVVGLSMMRIRRFVFVIIFLIWLILIRSGRRIRVSVSKKYRL